MDGVLATLDLDAVDGDVLDQDREVQLGDVAGGFHLVEGATLTVAVHDFGVHLELGQALRVPAPVRREFRLGEHDALSLLIGFGMRNGPPRVSSRRPVEWLRASSWTEALWP